jgi:hypothetical protein
MQNKELLRKKIDGIYSNLMNCYTDTQNYSPSITGAEREIFHKELLSKILPNNYRVGAGTITDSFGKETGQIDAVIELPFSLSFPISSVENRLYLADTIGAAFEIKSNLYNQWDDAISKIIEIRELSRYNIKKDEFAMLDDLKIPSFIISYKGFNNLDTIFKRLNSVAQKDWPNGIWIIESGVFYGRIGSTVYESETKTGSIMAFISCLYESLKSYASNTANLNTYFK